MSEVREAAAPTSGGLGGCGGATRVVVWLRLVAFGRLSGARSLGSPSF